MRTYQTPGVYWQEVLPARAEELRTGVPAFLGLAEKGAINTPQMLTLWTEFEEHFGPLLPDGYLAYAVRGFFENGGDQCYVVRLDDTAAAENGLREGLAALEPLDTIDLVCAPDIIRLRRQQELPSLDDYDPIWRAYIRRLLEQWTLSPDPNEVFQMQAAVLEHCETLGDRFAILDALPGASVEEAAKQRGELSGPNGALYYPWVRVLDGPGSTDGFIPPCGHVAGIYARSDRRVGVHKAPANEVLEGVLDLEVNLTDAQQGELNPKGVSCLRAFPGRGIRVWGARTLAGEENAEWKYVNVRRLFLTAGRWIERNMAGAVFEPNDARLWARINRDLTAYFNDLFWSGALKGSTPQEAFYVKCDAETNPPEVREAGMVVTEIGLAPAVPSEFVVVHIIHGASGITITGPSQPE